MIYIFDIDGTLANCDHRLKFIQQKPADWRAFFLACVDDYPIWEIAHIADSLNKQGHVILLVSGRSDEVRTQTSDWMAQHHIAYHEMYMRVAGDHREDSVVKAELVDKALSDWQKFSLGGIFEDRQQVVDMYRAKGLRVFQVAEGKF